jgi:hypothetical protein
MSFLKEKKKAKGKVKSKYWNSTFLKIIDLKLHIQKALYTFENNNPKQLSLGHSLAYLLDFKEKENFFGGICGEKWRTWVKRKDN